MNYLNPSKKSHSPERPAWLHKMVQILSLESTQIQQALHLHRCSKYEHFEQVFKTIWVNEKGMYSVQMFCKI